MEFEYYYNNVPEKGLCRNNLIYTSLISKDRKTFCQWYHNDTEYHKGQNQVIDPEKMQEKWSREVKFLIEMSREYKDKIPKILEIDYTDKKIYLEIDGPDFWEQAGCLTENYDKILPDWKEQMLSIIRAHKSLNLHKYSMHPSSYFIVGGELKSINYFFTYHKDEPNIAIDEVQSHIHSNRQEEMRKNLGKLGISWNDPQPWEVMDKLCWNSFRTNYPQKFIERCLRL
jgi:hypothetical protein